MTPNERLTKSGLPIDWTTILAGWRGIGPYRPRKMSGKEVVAYALDRIGLGTEEEDQIAALLANTDPQEWQTIDCYLELLTTNTTNNFPIAICVWRLAELKGLLETLDGGVYDDDETFALLYALEDFWLYYLELPDSASMIPSWGDGAVDMIRVNKKWAEQEEASIRAELNGSQQINPL